MQCIDTNSNTPRLYSQRLDSVIYWLINHCTDWARTGVTSFSCQFDFHDVIYHIWHCNIDNRRHNVLLKPLDIQNIRKYEFQSKQELRDIQNIRKYEFQSKQELQEILPVC